MQADSLPYSNTGFFSALLLDYIKAEPQLQPFYSHPVSLEGIEASIAQRKAYPTNRALLVQVLEQQYKDSTLTEKQVLYIQQLTKDNTFTICTAHQPNIFTGPLYFIYKILHAVKLAETLAAQKPDCNFVPVYYMGSEDADLDELGHFFINGTKYEWKTNQQGAVGRMKVDKALLQLLDTVSGQLLIHPHGSELVEMMRRCYQLGSTIEQSTFKLVNELFAQYGLLILLPDNSRLKRAFAPVIRKELLYGFSHKEVESTMAAFPKKYKVQAGGRELNMFYLKEDRRERLEVVGNGQLAIDNRQWEVINGAERFSEAEMLKELADNPERFSPNVILRPVFQETILPNIAFIGGGGEIAYWLELKKVFEAAGVPYPVLVTRNSFMLINAQQSERLQKLQFDHEAIFNPEFDLMNELVKRDSKVQLNLADEKRQIAAFYDQIKNIAAAVDSTLERHSTALQAKALEKIETLEKKMLRVEKKKFEAQQRQLHKLKQQLFPNNSLQERVENFMPYFARQGSGFIQMIFEYSLALEQEFVVLEER